MKLLYIASNPDGSPSLALEREITEIQRRLGRVITTQSVEMKFFTDLAFEDIATEISNYQPTILHISAHGDKEELALANADHHPVKIDGPTLAALLAVPNPPKIVYLNACNSMHIAESIAENITIAIGTSAPITNRAARASAVRFYELLFSGSSVQEAFDNSKALVNGLSERKTTTKMIHLGASKLDQMRFVEVLKVIARFGDADGPNFKPDADGVFEIEYGVSGCPQATSLIEFFTDDSENKVPSLGFQRTRPVRGKYWIGGAVYGDFLVGVVGMLGDGKVYAASSTLCDALRLYFSDGGYGILKPSKIQQFEEAIATLIKMDGAS